MTDIQQARDVLAKWRDGTTPGPWTSTVDTYGSDFGDYQAAEIPNVAVSVWTENDGPVAPLDPADSELIVGTAGNPELLDAIDNVLRHHLIVQQTSNVTLSTTGLLIGRIAAAILAADKRMNA